MELCEQFYYGATTCLDLLFPKEFKDEVPEMAVVLVATVVSGAVEFVCYSLTDISLADMCSWWVEDGQHRNVSFSADWHHAVCLSIIRLVADINRDAYHNTKLAQAHKFWAHHRGYVIIIFINNKLISSLSVCGLTLPMQTTPHPRDLLFTSTKFHFLRPCRI